MRERWRPRRAAARGLEPLGGEASRTATRSTSATSAARSRRSTSSGTSCSRSGTSSTSRCSAAAIPLGDVFLLKYRPHAERDRRRRRVLRPRRAGAPEVAAAALGRPARRLRDELPQVRHGGAPTTPAGGSRGSSTSSSRSSSSRWATRPSPSSTGSTSRSRTPLDAERVGEIQTLHADDRRARDTRHRRVARRAGRQDALLERVQGARSLVVRAPALLSADGPRARRQTRPALLGGLIAALAALGRVRRPPAGPLRSAGTSRSSRGSSSRRRSSSPGSCFRSPTTLRGCSPRRSRSARLRWCATWPGSDGLFNVAKVVAFTLFGFWFVQMLESLVVGRARRRGDPVGRRCVRLPRPDEGRRRGAARALRADRGRVRGARRERRRAASGRRT